MERMPQTAKGLLQSITMDTIDGMHRPTLDRMKKLDDFAALNDYMNTRNNEFFGNGAPPLPQLFEHGEAVEHVDNLMRWLDDRETNTADVEKQAVELVKDVQAASLEALAGRPNDFSGGMSVGVHGLEQLVEEDMVPKHLTVDFNIADERVAQLRQAVATLQREARLQAADQIGYISERLRETAEELFPEAKVLFDSGPGLKYWTIGLAEAILLSVDK